MFQSACGFLGTHEQAAPTPAFLKAMETVDEGAFSGSSPVPAQAKRQLAGWFRGCASATSARVPRGDVGYVFGGSQSTDMSANC